MRLVGMPRPVPIGSAVLMPRRATVVVAVAVVVVVVVRRIVPAALIVASSVTVTMPVVAVVTMLVIVCVVRRPLTAHLELRRAHASPDHALNPDGVGRNRQASQGGADLRNRQTGIDQRAQDHVAGGAREAVEVENPQTSPSYQPITPAEAASSPPPSSSSTADRQGSRDPEPRCP